jgi:hypothetical protein
LLLSTAVLRGPDGKLSVERIAKVYGVNPARIAKWLGRYRHANLEYFERIAGLLAAVPEPDFRKWLCQRNPLLGMETPLAWIDRRRFQPLADLVDDILTGSPT